MNLDFRLALMLALAPAPTFASDDMSITFRNDSARAVTISGVYTVSPSGEIVDDNIGAVIDPIRPGTEHILDLSLTRCGKVWIRAYFADGEEVIGTTDLCRNSTIILHD